MARRPDIRGPTREIFDIDPQVGITHRLDAAALAAAPIARDDPDAVESGEHIELGDHEVGQTVHARRIARGDRVEPAAAPRATGDDPEFMASRAQALADLIVQF